MKIQASSLRELNKVIETLIEVVPNKYRKLRDICLLANGEVADGKSETNEVELAISEIKHLLEEK